MKNYLIGLVLLVVSGVGLAADDLVYTPWSNNLGAGGYDVTAYFSEGKPVKGDSAFQTEYQGADWRFASKGNLEKFLDEPERYAPQYGGYCAWAVSQNKTASGDPLQWTVHGDKLYLNYNKSINKRWLKEKERFIVDGDRYWPTVLE